MGNRPGSPASHPAIACGPAVGERNIMPAFIGVYDVFSASLAGRQVRCALFTGRLRVRGEPLRAPGRRLHHLVRNGVLRPANPHRAARPPHPGRHRRRVLRCRGRPATWSRYWEHLRVRPASCSETRSARAAAGHFRRGKQIPGHWTSIWPSCGGFLRPGATCSWSRARTSSSDPAEIERRVLAFAEAGADAVLKVDGLKSLDAGRTSSSGKARAAVLLQSDRAGGKSPPCTAFTMSSRQARA